MTRLPTRTLIDALRNTVATAQANLAFPVIAYQVHILDADAGVFGLSLQLEDNPFALFDMKAEDTLLFHVIEHLQQQGVRPSVCESDISVTQPDHFNVHLAFVMAAVRPPLEGIFQRLTNASWVSPWRKVSNVFPALPTQITGLWAAA